MHPQFDFGEALKHLKEGKRVERSGWNGKGMWLLLVREWNSVETCDLEEIEAPFIVMKTVQNEFVPWLASQTDVLAEDWSEVD